MNADRQTAVIVGVLFILATVFSLVSTSIIAPVIGAPDYLVKISANDNQVIVGVLLLLAAAVSIVLIPAMLFPILRRHYEGMALGYFGFRILEAITLVVDAISLLLLMSLSREYVKAGLPAASYFQTSGALLLSAHDWIFPLNPIIFGLGALMFYYLLYRSRLIPRWLSAWGLLGAALVLAFGLLGLFGNILIYLALPIAVQEMALAGWLIVKGFNPSAFISESAKKSSQ